MCVLIEQWNFYLSGILYGIFKKQEGRIYHRSLDVYTGQLTDWQELDEKYTWYHELGNFILRCTNSVSLFFSKISPWEVTKRGQLPAAASELFAALPSFASARQPCAPASNSSSLERASHTSIFPSS